MHTYVSMLTWCGEPQPTPADVRAAIDAQSFEFRERGLHSLVFLPDRVVCAAIMVSSSVEECEIDVLAQSILPDDDVQITSMRFDDVPALLRPASTEVAATPSSDELVAIYQAVVAG